jgi:hypothetical protein
MLSSAPASKPEPSLIQIEIAKKAAIFRRGADGANRPLHFYTKARKLGGSQSTSCGPLFSLE